MLVITDINMIQQPMPFLLGYPTSNFIAHPHTVLSTIFLYCPLSKRVLFHGVIKPNCSLM